MSCACYCHHPMHIKSSPQCNCGCIEARIAYNLPYMPSMVYPPITVPGAKNWLADLPQDMELLSQRLQKQESHIDKLQDMLNLEDRITACDVLNRLTLLEEQLSAYEDLLQHAQGGIEKCFERIEVDRQVYAINHEFVTDIMKRLVKLEEQNHWLKTQVGKLQEEGESKRPYKCPWCESCGLSPSVIGCRACNQTGILWG